MRRLGRHKLLWTAIALLALITAGLGIWSPSIYEGVISDEIMPGVLAQDLFSVAAAVAVLSLVPFLRQRDLPGQLLVVGLLIYFFYAFGIYTIERIYNAAYLAYLGIFSLSFFGIVYAGASLDRSVESEVSVPGWVRNLSVGYLLVNAAVFIVLWTSQLLPLMETGEKIEFFYSIFILDLAFIMPAFLIVGVMALRGQTFGLLSVGPLLVAGFAVLCPLGLTELLEPVVYETAMDAGSAALFGGLSGVFLVLAVVYLKGMHVNGEASSRESG
jgi:hypothetical protein